MKKSPKNRHSLTARPRRHASLTKSELIGEAEALQTQVRNLERSVDRLKRQYSNSRQYQNNYLSLFRHSNAVMLLIDPGNGDIVDANESACKFYGWNRKTLLKMNITDINTLPEKGIRKALSQGKAKTKSRFIFRHRRANRRISDVEVISTPIRVGNNTLLHAIIYDITPRKRAERALEKAHSELEANVAERTLALQDAKIALEAEIEERKSMEVQIESFFNLSDDMLCIASMTHFLKVNPSFRRVLGYTDKELMRIPFMELIHPDDIAHTQRAMEEKLKKGLSVISFVNRYRHKDGSYRWFEWTTRPVIEKGLLYGVARDVTRRKEMEDALKQALHDKDLLIKEVHHRTKNNLSIIQSLLRLQSRRITDLDARALFDQGRERLQALSMVHERLYRSTDLRSVEFSEYVRSLANALTGSSAHVRSHIRVSVDVPKTTLDVNSVIPSGLIINELVTNSIKHAFPDGRKGTIKISFRKREDGHCQLEVTDDGVGFPEGVSLDDLDTLGLGIVRSLTAQLKGNLRLSSGAYGTTVTVTFVGKKP